MYASHDVTVAVSNSECRRDMANNKINMNRLSVATLQSVFVHCTIHRIIVFLGKTPNGVCTEKKIKAASAELQVPSPIYKVWGAFLGVKKINRN